MGQNLPRPYSAVLRRYYWLWAQEQSVVMLGAQCMDGGASLMGCKHGMGLSIVLSLLILYSEGICNKCYFVPREMDPHTMNSPSLQYRLTHLLQNHVTFLELTKGVSFPPTMLRPSPDCPLDISIIISWPGMIGHVAGSTDRGAWKLPGEERKACELWMGLCV